ncbi:MAG TPA: hypothetical protein VF304_12380 [Casimicrobiaceae bacterium]
MNKKSIAFAFLTAGLLASGVAGAASDDLHLAQGWYGPPRDARGGDRDRYRGNWAVGTFHGKNGANGNEETITIKRDGTAELRTRGEAPKYGTFEGETLTLGSRISKVEPARGGIVIDGAYYRR